MGRANAKLVMIYRTTYGLDIPAPDFLHPYTLSIIGNTLRYIIPLMQDGYLPTFILLICYKSMEPIAGSHRDMPSSWNLPVRTRYAQPDFILFLTSTLLNAPDVLVHSLPQRDGASEKTMHYTGRKRTGQYQQLGLVLDFLEPHHHGKCRKLPICDCPP